MAERNNSLAIIDLAKELQLGYETNVAELEQVFGNDQYIIHKLEFAANEMQQSHADIHTVGLHRSAYSFETNERASFAIMPSPDDSQTFGIDHSSASIDLEP